MAAPTFQTPGQAPFVAKASDEPTAVMLDTVDCLSVGMSLRMLARDMKVPHGTREVYARVGNAMVAAARLSLVEVPK